MKKPSDKKKSREELRKQIIGLGDFSGRKSYYPELMAKISELEGEINERIKAEKEMTHLQNLLSNIINSMPSMLVGVDVEGNVTQWNREAEKTTGITAQDARGCNLAHAFPQLAGEMNKIRQAIRDHRILKDEKVLIDTANGQRISDVTIYPLMGEDFEEAVIRIDDITERVRMEEMMIQTEKMLSLGGLAAGMAHEIKNPLAGVLQNMQVIRNRLSGTLAKNRQAAEESGSSLESLQSYMEKRGIFEMLDSVMESSHRAVKIVNNMLGFSRKSESEFTLKNLGELLDQTVDIARSDYDLKKQYDFKQIEIVREYDPNVPAVPCDGSKIQQVFLNILKNGAEAMAEEKVQMRKTNTSEKIPRFVLRIMSQGNMARIEMEDNGPGMDKTTRKRVFEPFFTTKKAGVGTGLGLSVSYFIITECHDGIMAVESAPGKGTKFTIQLPFNH